MNQFDSIHGWHYLQDFDYQWLIDEMSLNLPLELNFSKEMQNADRCRANLSSPASRLGTGRVHVPHCLPELTSPRVLTMEFIGDAVGVSDVEGMRKMGIR